MTPNRIDPVKMREMIADGRGTKEIAHDFGVSMSAVSQRNKELNISATKILGELRTQWRFHAAV